MIGVVVMLGGDALRPGPLEATGTSATGTEGTGTAARKLSQQEPIRVLCWATWSCGFNQREPKGDRMLFTAGNHGR